jgi:COP9 signalosome complex subunit 3
MDLNKLVTSIQALSDNEGDLKQLKTQLTKSEDVLLKNLNLLDDALSVLDPGRHSLGWLFILAVKAIAPRIDPQRYITQVQVFLQNCNSQQVRLALFKLVKVCRRFAELLVEVRQPMRGIVPLKLAVAALRDDSHQLTPIHTDLVQLCLLAKCYRAVIPILDEELYEVNPDATGITPKDLLCYYYYGGRVYIGMKQYKKALEFFKLVFTAPAVVLSAIMVEAFKKYILVSLIVHGQVAAIPKYTSSVVHRHIKNTCPQYHEFANAFASHNVDEVHKCASTHAELFQKDGNFGLVKQCIQALNRSNIKRHTQTYLTLSLPDIAESVKLANDAEAERSVLRMIEDGEIFACINQRDGMVSFQEDPEHYNTNKMMQHLDGQINKVAALDKKLKSVDEMIALTPAYVQKMTGHDRHARWADFEEASFHETDKAFPPVGSKF